MLVLEIAIFLTETSLPMRALLANLRLQSILLGLTGWVRS